MPRTKGIKELTKRIPRKRMFKEVRCAFVKDGIQCPTIISVMAVTGKSVCEECYKEQMNIYRRGEKPVIGTTTAR